jgi:serine O-acetyltransferase
MLKRGIRKMAQSKFRYTLSIVYNFMVILTRRNIKCKVPFSTRFNHGGINTVIGKKVILEEDCVIGTGVVLGGRHFGSPIIEHHCILCTHSIVIGHIRVGHHSVIGAGAVVLHDIPPFSIVVGVPAKVIKTITLVEYKEYLRERR